MSWLLYPRASSLCVQLRVAPFQNTKGEGGWGWRERSLAVRWQGDGVYATTKIKHVKLRTEKGQKLDLKKEQKGGESRVWAEETWCCKSWLELWHKLNIGFFLPFFFVILDSISSLHLPGTVPGHALFEWRLKDVSAAARSGSITHTVSEKDTHCSRNDTFESGRGYLLARRSEEQSARTWRPFILPNHLLWGECGEISARMTAKRPGPLACCVALSAQKQINYRLFLRRTDNVHSNAHSTHVCVNVSIVAGGLPADVCGEDVNANANNLSELWHRCGSYSGGRVDDDK